MSERSEWVPDLGRGDWLRVMEPEPLGSILSVVPSGFESYARIFRPVTRDRRDATKTWRILDERAYLDGIDDIDAALETERVPWWSAAASFGTTMHAEAQYVRRAPWVDEVNWAQSSSLLWPEDHSWVLATELDFDSTLVAGNAALIRELEQAPDLEVHKIQTDADLSTSGDAINLPE